MAAAKSLSKKKGEEGRRGGRGGGEEGRRGGGEEGRRGGGEEGRRGGGEEGRRGGGEEGYLVFVFEDWKWHLDEQGMIGWLEVPAELFGYLFYNKRERK